MAVRHGSRRALAVLVVVLIVVGAAVAAARAWWREPPSRVALFGDSLGAEIDRYLDRALGGGVDLEAWTYGGTAICDWFDEMRREVERFDPEVVVFVFSGNNLTSCVGGGDGVPLRGGALLRRYIRDAERAMDLVDRTGARVYWVGVPVGHDARDDFTRQLNERYRRFAEEYDGVEFVAAHEAVLDDGRFTETLPCQDGEPCNGGRARVRSPDGRHFCPVPQRVERGVLPECPVFSPGASRYAGAIADALTTPVL